MDQGTTSGGTRALDALMHLGREAGFRLDQAWHWSLGWLAMSRLLLLGDLGDRSTLKDLLGQQIWHLALDRGIPIEAMSAVWPPSQSVQQGDALRSKALGIVAALIDQQGDSDWGLTDAAWHIRGLPGSPPSFSPDLCDLLVEALDPETGSAIWIPFDHSGQLTTRAARRGVRVQVSGPWEPSTTLRLTLCIALTSAERLNVSLDDAPPRSPHAVSVKHILATPPFGAKVGDGRWGRWTVDAEQTPNRSDTWAVANLWPLASDKAVFLVSPAFLFAKGQEQKARASLISSEANPVQAVAQLPTRLLSDSGAGCGVLLLDRSMHHRSVRLIDAAAAASSPSSAASFSRVFDAERIKSLLTLEVNGEPAIDVPVDKLYEQEYSLTAGRYLRPTLSGGPRVKLSEIVDLVRAPTVSKDHNFEASEVGIPDLDRWRPIAGPFTKAISVNRSKIENHALCAGDIVISVKGSLGKSGIFGDQKHAGAHSPPVVASQSCVALRPKLQRILPEFLLLYLRSDEFRSQMDGLRSGSVIGHVTPNALLQISVPLPTLEQQSEMTRKFAEACELESSIEAQVTKLDSLRKSLWPI